MTDEKDIRKNRETKDSGRQEVIVHAAVAVFPKHKRNSQINFRHAESGRFFADIIELLVRYKIAPWISLLAETVAVE